MDDNVFSNIKRFALCSLFIGNNLIFNLSSKKENLEPKQFWNDSRLPLVSVWSVYLSEYISTLGKMLILGSLNGDTIGHNVLIK